jgi:hypothetical protein
MTFGLCLAYAPNERTGIPLSLKCWLLQEAQFRNNDAGRKRGENGRKLDRCASLISWSLEGEFESEHPGLLRLWDGGCCS